MSCTYKSQRFNIAFPLQNVSKKSLLYFWLEKSHSMKANQQLCDHKKSGTSISPVCLPVGLMVAGGLHHPALEARNVLGEFYLSVIYSSSSSSFFLSFFLPFYPGAIDIDIDTLWRYCSMFMSVGDLWCRFILFYLILFYSSEEFD